MANGYGISKWEDAKQINKELKNLTDQPIYCVSEENLKQILEHFNTKMCKIQRDYHRGKEVYSWRCSTQPRIQLPLPDVYGKSRRRIFVRP